MNLLEALDRARELLQSKRRITYRMLKAQFQLDEESLETLKEELIKAEQVARDEDGTVLVWVGASPVPGSKFQVEKSSEFGVRSQNQLLIRPHTWPSAS